MRTTCAYFSKVITTIRPPFARAGFSHNKSRVARRILAGPKLPTAISARALRNPSDFVNLMQATVNVFEALLPLRDSFQARGQV
jgi:hypothetical protein